MADGSAAGNEQRRRLGAGLEQLPRTPSSGSVSSGAYQGRLQPLPFAPPGVTGSPCLSPELTPLSQKENPLPQNVQRTRTDSADLVEALSAGTSSPLRIAGSISAANCRESVSRQGTPSRLGPHVQGSIAGRETTPLGGGASLLHEASPPFESERSSDTSQFGVGALAPLTSVKTTLVVQSMTEESEHSFGAGVDIFTLKELLGEGSFGSVYSCQHNMDGTNYAVKVIDASRLAMLLGYPVELVVPRLHRECEILQHLGEHPNVLQLIFAFFSQQSSRFYLVTELLEGGELFHAIVKRKKPFDESDGRKIFAQIVDAVAFCHAMGVAHRDLKLENCIFVDKRSLRVKLCDYGQAKMLVGDIVDTARTLTTTPVYTAPEVAKAVQAAESYDAFKADSFGLGIILYGLLCSALPNAATGRSYEGCRAWSSLSADVKDLIRLCLHPDPKLRPSPEEIKSHAWILKNADLECEALSPPISPVSDGDGTRDHNLLVDSLLAYQQFIVGVQRERGTCCWALGSDEGERAFRWQMKFTDERLEEVSALVASVVSSGEFPSAEFVSLGTSVAMSKTELHELRPSCVEKIEQREDVLDGQEEFLEVFSGYTRLVTNVINAMLDLLPRVKGDSRVTAQELNLRLMQMVAEQLGRERAFIAGHLAQPETMRLASVVRNLAEIVGARKVFLGSSQPSKAIVASESGLMSSLYLSEQGLFDLAELTALEQVEDKALSSKKVDAPLVAEFWFHLTKIIDKAHQHIMVAIVEFFTAC